MFRLMRYYRPFWKEILIGPLFKVVEVIFELFIPLVVADIIDVGVSTGDRGYVIHRGLLLAALYAIAFCSTLVCQFLASRASQSVGTKLRDDLFRHALSLSSEQVDALGAPTLVNRITGDINQVQGTLALSIRLLVRWPILAVGSIVMAMTQDLMLSLIFIAASALAAALFYAVMRRQLPLLRAIQGKLDALARIARESLSGVRVIRAFSRQSQERERFAQAGDDVARHAILAGKLSAALNPGTTALLNFSILLILWFAAPRVQIGELTQGQVVALVNYMMQILLAMVMVANFVIVVTRGNAAAARVSEIFDLVPAIAGVAVASEESAHKTMNPAAPRIAFESVSFAFAGAPEQALSDLSFAIPAGQTVGVIGGTGSGKSTLVSLIPRFYEATAGRVLVDGVPVEQYPIATLRRRIAVVPQKALLFSQTIRENLCWAKPDATDGELFAALSIAQAADFVSAMPDGLDTPLSAGGKNLSGGQRQRLTIARALVGDPDVLILDDSASALDYATEAALRRALGAYRSQRAHNGGVTMLTVSQRAASLRECDSILVLEDGRLAGFGPHEELLKTCAVYREICSSQLRASEGVGA